MQSRILHGAGRIDTGALRNSVTHEVRMNEEAVYVGSDLKYAPYVEYGTGKYGENGGTGSSWRVYVVGSGGNGVKRHGRRYERNDPALLSTL